jgi:hypothetical protein
MFECYLDDSGTSGLPIVTLGGFYAPKTNWEALEPILDSLLNEYGIPVFHAKQFHDTKTPFENWRRVKKRSFTDELFGTTHGQIAGVSVAIKRGEFEQAKKDQSKWDNMSAIGVCFSAIMVKIVTDKETGPVIKNQGISFLVEAGNRNNAEIENFFNKMAKEPVFEGCLRSINFISKSNCRAIQLADFLAFYSRRNLRDHARFDGKISLPACPILDIMRRHGPIWQNVSRGLPKSTGRWIGKDLHTLDELSSVANKN